MELHLVAVKSYKNSFDANVAVAKLNDSGIEAVVKNTDSVFITNETIDVLVKETDLAKAKEILG